jgi:ABC-type branched-subunit amino acid transport system substrate-binding protein
MPLQHGISQSRNLQPRSHTWIAWPLAALLFSGTGFVQANEDRAADHIIGLLAFPDHPESGSLQRGATLALEHHHLSSDIKARLAVRGRPGQWGTEGDEAAALALDDAADAIITPSDGVAAHQVLQVAGRTRIPVVSLCPDSSITRAGIPWAVRIVPGNEAEALAIFTGLSAPGRKPARWAAIVPHDRAGREAARDLLAAARTAGVSLQPPLQAPSASTELQPSLQKLTADLPGAILLWLDPQTAGRCARDLRQAGFAGVLAGPGPLQSALFLASAKDAAEGVIVPGIIPNAESEAQHRRFSEAHRNRFATEPDLAATMAYDAASLLVHLLKQARQQPLYRSFPVTNTFPGASGTLQFDQDGNRTVPLRLLVRQSGEFKPLPNAKPSASR